MMAYKRNTVILMEGFLWELFGKDGEKMWNYEEPIWQNEIQQNEIQV